MRHRCIYTGTCGDENRRAPVAVKLSNRALVCEYEVSMSMANAWTVESRWGITHSSLRAPKPSSRHCFDEGYGARSRECLIFEEPFFAHIVRICITNDTSKAGFVKLEAIASFSGEFALHPLSHPTYQGMRMGRCQIACSRRPIFLEGTWKQRAGHPDHLEAAGPPQGRK